MEVSFNTNCSVLLTTTRNGYILQESQGVPIFKTCCGFVKCHQIKIAQKHHMCWNIVELHHPLAILQSFK